jgi:hypothetical protein
MNINELVATKVMGWTVVDREERGWGAGPVVYHISQDVDEPYFQDFRPSTNLVHAWMVVEHLKSQEPPLHVSIVDYANCYHCNFTPAMEWRPFTNREHLSVPMAICLAALAAKGVEYEA